MQHHKIIYSIISLKIHGTIYAEIPIGIIAITPDELHFNIYDSQVVKVTDTIGRSSVTHAIHNLEILRGYLTGSLFKANLLNNSANFESFAKAYLQKLRDNSRGLIVYSPPKEIIYNYSIEYPINHSKLLANIWSSISTK